MSRNERLNGLVDQDSVQLTITLGMVENVVVDELSVKLPLVLEQCGRWLGTVSWPKGNRAKVGYDPFGKSVNYTLVLGESYKRYERGTLPASSCRENYLPSCGATHLTGKLGPIVVGCARGARHRPVSRPSPLSLPGECSSQRQQRHLNGRIAQLQNEAVVLFLVNRGS
jgi:hypothetical protein